MGNWPPEAMGVPLQSGWEKTVKDARSSRFEMYSVELVCLAGKARAPALSASRVLMVVERCIVSSLWNWRRCFADGRGLRCL